MLFLLMVMGKIAFSWAEAPSTPSQKIEQAFAASGVFAQVQEGSSDLLIQINKDKSPDIAWSRCRGTIDSKQVILKPPKKPSFTQ